MNKRGVFKRETIKEFIRLHKKAAIPLIILAFFTGCYLLSELLFFITPLNKTTFSGYADSWRIYARDGRLLREAVNKDGSRSQWADQEIISPLVIDATIAVEDERFYSHSGIDWIAMGRAILQNLSAGENVSGASTITMQLARLMYDLPHSLDGKILQIIDALRIEHSVDKKTILLNYLNRSPYGNGAIGIEAASYCYFGKPSMHLSLAEAALLAGLPNGPSKYNPLTNFSLAKKRQAFVLFRLMESGKITQEDYSRGLSEALTFYSGKEKLEAMHFTDYIMSQHPPPGDVSTTLDLDLNTQVEDIVRDHVRTLAAGGLTNASVVILDNKTGAILSMVGSVNYWDGDNGAVNGAVSLRQPGSTLKPFTYALAFERGFSPVTVIADIKTQYIDNNGDIYIPRNYSDKYYGPVLMAEALGRSLNVSAIRIANMIGVSSLLDTLKEAGFTSLHKDADFYGLGLTLGNGEVTLLELAQGYALFPRKGIPCKAEAVTSLLTPPDDKKLLFSEQVCFLITDILSNEQLRIRAFGPLNPLLLPFPMAIKTGTSSNWRDNWVVGYTEEITIAVWAGDFKGSPMNQVSGAIGAGPLFRKIALLANNHLSLTPGTSAPPPGVQKIVICKLSGGIPSEYCTDYASWYVIKDEEKRPFCHVHKKVAIDIRNGLLASSKCPSHFTEDVIGVYLDPGYAEWQSENGYHPPPTRYSPLCMPDEIAVDALVITHPQEHDIFIIEPGYNPETQSLELKGEADPPVGEIEWIVDKRLVATAPWPYSASWQLKKGKHTLYMKSGDKKSDTVVFEVR
ncbi:MAG: penicillin-binding protein 1C [Spirochaetales bacterium]|nr:penicillin-binding protein 1C [Spirochaetales bacterium]